MSRAHCGRSLFSGVGCWRFAKGVEAAKPYGMLYTMIMVSELSSTVNKMEVFKPHQSDPKKSSCERIEELPLIGIDAIRMQNCFS